MTNFMIYKKFAIDLAKQAGEIIRKNFKLGMEKQLKADSTPVTEADLAINKLVLESIRKVFPGHGILSEEGSDLKDNAEFVWVCDPIDGTIPFSHGIPTCAFSLALTKNGKSILGVVNQPFSDRLFSAELGKGTFLNNQPVKVSGHDTFKGAIIGYEFWKAAKYAELAATYQDFIAKDIGDLLNLGSVVHAGALVSCGAVDACMYPHINAHDVAAIKILVEEAGGKATDLFGNEQRYDQPIKGFVASNKILHGRILEITRPYLKGN